MKGMEAIGNAASSIASNTKSKVDEMNLMNRRAEILKDVSTQAYALWLKGEKFPEAIDSLLKELSELDETLVDLRAERLAGVKTGSGKEEAAGETVPADETEAADHSQISGEAAAEDADESADSKEDQEDQNAEASPEGAEPDGETAPDADETEEETASEASGNADAEEKDAVPVIRVENGPEAPKADSSLSSAINDLFEKAPSAEEAAQKVNSVLDSLEDQLKDFSDSIGESIQGLTDRISGKDSNSTAE